MLLRDKIGTALKRAVKQDDTTRLGTLRLITTAINDLETAKQGCEEGMAAQISNDEVMEILQKMIDQRLDSTRAYEEAGRLELADQERAEAELIEEFLPRPLSEDEKVEAIRAAISETGAASLRDLGKVMGLLKERHAGRLDFTTICPEVRDTLAR